MRFNNYSEEDIGTKLESTLSLAQGNDRLITIGTMIVDEHNRLTFNKRIKSILPLRPGDTVVVIQDPMNDNLLFRIQRGTGIADCWLVKRIIQ